MTGLYEVTAIVGSIPARMFSVIVIALFGLPTLLGICYSGQRYYRRRDWLETQTGLVSFSLFVLVSAWFSWYLFFSVSWIRYLFPASFVGSIFVAVMFYELTNHFDFTFIIKRSAALFRTPKFDRRGLGVLVVVVIICTSALRTWKMFYELYVRDADASVQEVARFLNTETPTDSLIETYDSELFFFLDRPYHYPPDQLHVELIRRKFLYDDHVAINYDPLRAQPKYLVVGPHSKQWSLYDPVLKSGVFRLLRTYNRYTVYERQFD